MNPPSPYSRHFMDRFHAEDSCNHLDWKAEEAIKALEDLHDYVDKPFEKDAKNLSEFASREIKHNIEVLKKSIMDRQDMLEEAGLTEKDLGGDIDLGKIEESKEIESVVSLTVSEQQGINAAAVKFGFRGYDTDLDTNNTEDKKDSDDMSLSTSKSDLRVTPTGTNTSPGPRAVPSSSSMSCGTSGSMISTPKSGDTGCDMHLSTDPKQGRSKDLLGGHVDVSGGRSTWTNTRSPDQRPFGSSGTKSTNDAAITVTDS